MGSVRRKTAVGMGVDDGQMAFLSTVLSMPEAKRAFLQTLAQLRLSYDPFMSPPFDTQETQRARLEQMIVDFNAYQLSHFSANRTLPSTHGMQNVSAPPPIYRRINPTPSEIGDLLSPGAQPILHLFSVGIRLPAGEWHMTFTASGAARWKYNVTGPPNDAGINADGTQYVELMNAGPIGFTWYGWLESGASIGICTIGGSGYEFTTNEPIRMDTIQIQISL